MAGNLEIVKKWTPWAATAVIIVFSLLIFWGVISVIMKFLGASSYFDVPAADTSLSSDSIRERNDQVTQLLKAREQARQAAGAAQELGAGERDPFKLQ